jgi:hypothetical protein
MTILGAIKCVLALSGLTTVSINSTTRDTLRIYVLMYKLPPFAEQAAVQTGSLLA